MGRKLALLITVILLVPMIVFAESSLTLPSVEVDLWPEYDNPGVLVIYRINLPDGLSFPTEFMLRIPSGVSTPYAVAERMPDDSLMNLQYKVEPAGNWNVLRVTVASPTDYLQIEFYDDNLKKDGTARQYVYQWPGDYAVQALIVQVKQPKNANRMNLPALFGKGVAGEDGMLDYTANVGALSADQALEIPLGYQKPDDTLSVSDLAVSPSQPIPGRQPLPTWLVPALLLLVGVGLIGGGFWWYWHSGRSHSRQLEPARVRHKPASGEKDSSSDGQVYCQQCGKRASPGDRFCRACGTQLRTSNGG